MSIPRLLRSHRNRFNRAKEFWSFTKARAVRESIVTDIVEYQRVMQDFAEQSWLWDSDSQEVFASRVKPGTVTAWPREIKTLLTLLGTAWITQQRSIRLTEVGTELLNSSDPRILLEQQVRKYQLGNPELDQKLTGSIRTIPHYVLLKLLLDSYPKAISRQEFVLFVMTIKSHSQISTTWSLLRSFRQLSEKDLASFVNGIHGTRYQKLDRIAQYALRFLTLPPYLKLAAGQVSVADHEEAERILAWYDQGHSSHIAFQSLQDWFTHYGGLHTTPNPMVAADYYRKMGDAPRAGAAYEKAIRYRMTPLNDSAEKYRYRINGEAALEKWIVENLERIEPGLSLVERQYEASQAGRMDILARDREGNYVVIELKRDMASDEALGQLLRYVGWTRRHLAGDAVRGYVIGDEIDKHMEYAIDAHDALGEICKLRTYGDLEVQLKIKGAGKRLKASVEDLRKAKSTPQRHGRRKRN